MSNKFRWLWHSNAPHAGTGYGNQTAVFTPRIQAAGYGMTISAFWGREGAPAMNEHGILELPRYRDPYGNDVIEAHRAFSKSDAVISLIDPFVNDPRVWSSFPWCAWTPVDSAPVAPENLAALKVARWVWSMSKFGHEQLTAAGLKPAYVPHGIETKIYRPVDRAKARRSVEAFLKVDLQGKFLVVTVAANKGAPSRKNFAGMFEAFAGFAKSHPDAVFYLHTDAAGRYGGDDLLALAQAAGVADRLIFPPEYNLMLGLIPPDYLNDVYNAADVYLLLSYGEGFGLPTVEAQAAGCPVIVADGSTGPELCFSGEVVPAVPVQALSGRYGCRWWMAIPGAATQALERAYQQQQDGERRTAASVGALAYDADKVFTDYMLPALRAMETEIKRAAVIAGPNGRWVEEGMIHAK